MVLKTFRAEHYRNIEKCEIQFTDGVNLLFGDNAQGKTNALEAIYSFARGKSFRGAADKELTMFGEKDYTTEIVFQNKDREETLTYRFADEQRRRFRNGVPQKKLADMLGHFRAVLFFPEHLQIIKGGPEKRREFLNVAISQNDGAYLSLYTEYAKILENRNCLLKNAQKGLFYDEAELVAWSEKMAETAAEIYLKRKEYVRGIEPLANGILSELSGKREKLTLTYLSDTEEETREGAKRAFVKVLTENLKRECAAGCSLFGVQRDDMEVMLGETPARLFASQGQQRSLVLSLKLAEGAYSEHLTKDSPVYLFDDVLSELDEARRRFVFSGMGEKQLILTACDTHFEGAGYHAIRVTGGNYVSAHRE